MYKEKGWTSTQQVPKKVVPCFVGGGRKVREETLLLVWMIRRSFAEREHLPMQWGMRGFQGWRLAFLVEKKTCNQERGEKWKVNVTEFKFILPAAGQANKSRNELLGQEIATLFWEASRLKRQWTSVLKTHLPYRSAPTERNYP